MATITTGVGVSSVTLPVDAFGIDQDRITLYSGDAPESEAIVSAAKIEGTYTKLNNNLYQSISNPRYRLRYGEFFTERTDQSSGHVLQRQASRWVLEVGITLDALADGLREAGGSTDSLYSIYDNNGIIPPDSTSTIGYYTLFTATTSGTDLTTIQWDAYPFDANRTSPSGTLTIDFVTAFTGDDFNPADTVYQVEREVTFPSQVRSLIRVSDSLPNRISQAPSIKLDRFVATNGETFNYKLANGTEAGPLSANEFKFPESELLANQNVTQDSYTGATLTNPPDNYPTRNDNAYAHRVSEFSMLPDYFFKDNNPANNTILCYLPPVKQLARQTGITYRPMTSFAEFPDLGREPESVVPLVIRDGARPKGNAQGPFGDLYQLNVGQRLIPNYYGTADANASGHNHIEVARPLTACDTGSDARLLMKSAEVGSNLKRMRAITKHIKQWDRSNNRSNPEYNGFSPKVDRKPFVNDRVCAPFLRFDGELKFQGDSWKDPTRPANVPAAFSTSGTLINQTADAYEFRIKMNLGSTLDASARNLFTTEIPDFDDELGNPTYVRRPDSPKRQSMKRDFLPPFLMCQRDETHPRILKATLNQNYNDSYLNYDIPSSWASTIGLNLVASNHFMQNNSAGFNPGSGRQYRNTGIGGFFRRMKDDKEGNPNWLHYCKDRLEMQRHHLKRDPIDGTSSNHFGYSATQGGTRRDSRHIRIVYRNDSPYDASKFTDSTQVPNGPRYVFRIYGHHDTGTTSDHNNSPLSASKNDFFTYGPDYSPNTVASSATLKPHKQFQGFVNFASDTQGSESGVIFNPYDSPNCTTKGINDPRYESNDYVDLYWCRAKKLDIGYLPRPIFAMNSFAYGFPIAFAWDSEQDVGTQTAVPGVGYHDVTGQLQVSSYSKKPLNSSNEENHILTFRIYRDASTGKVTDIKAMYGGQILRNDRNHFSSDSLPNDTTGDNITGFKGKYKVGEGIRVAGGIIGSSAFTFWVSEIYTPTVPITQGNFVQEGWRGLLLSGDIHSHGTVNYKTNDRVTRPVCPFGFAPSMKPYYTKTTQQIMAIENTPDYGSSSAPGSTSYIPLRDDTGVTSTYQLRVMNEWESNSFRVRGSNSPNAGNSLVRKHFPLDATDGSYKNQYSQHFGYPTALMSFSQRYKGATVSNFHTATFDLAHDWYDSPKHNDCLTDALGVFNGSKTKYLKDIEFRMEIYGITTLPIIEISTGGRFVPTSTVVVLNSFYTTTTTTTTTCTVFPSTYTFTSTYYGGQQGHLVAGSSSCYTHVNVNYNLRFLTTKKVYGYTTQYGFSTTAENGTSIYYVRHSAILQRPNAASPKVEALKTITKNITLGSTPHAGALIDRGLLVFGAGPMQYPGNNCTAYHHPSFKRIKILRNGRTIHRYNCIPQGADRGEKLLAIPNLVYETDPQSTVEIIYRNPDGVGTVHPYTITGHSGSGITLDDFKGLSSLSGSFTMNAQGFDSVILQINSDLITEGTEYFQLTMDNTGASVVVEIRDSSLEPTYALTSLPAQLPIATNLLRPAVATLRGFQLYGTTGDNIIGHYGSGSADSKFRKQNPVSFLDNFIPEYKDKWQNDERMVRTQKFVTDSSNDEFAPYGNEIQYGGIANLFNGNYNVRRSLNQRFVAIGGNRKLVSRDGNYEIVRPTVSNPLEIDSVILSGWGKPDLPLPSYSHAISNRGHRLKYLLTKEQGTIQLADGTTPGIDGILQADDYFFGPNIDSSWLYKEYANQASSTFSKYIGRSIQGQHDKSFFLYNAWACPSGYGLNIIEDMPGEASAWDKCWALQMALNRSMSWNNERPLRDWREVNYGGGSNWYQSNIYFSDAVIQDSNMPTDQLIFTNYEDVKQVDTSRKYKKLGNGIYRGECTHTEGAILDMIIYQVAGLGGGRPTTTWDNEFPVGTFFRDIANPFIDFKSSTTVASYLDAPSFKATLQGFKFSDSNRPYFPSVNLGSSSLDLRENLYHTTYIGLTVNSVSLSLLGAGYSSVYLNTNSGTSTFSYLGPFYYRARNNRQGLRRLYPHYSQGTIFDVCVPPNALTNSQIIAATGGGFRRLEPADLINNLSGNYREHLMPVIWQIEKENDKNLGDTAPRWVINAYVDQITDSDSKYDGFTEEYQLNNYDTFQPADSEYGKRGENFTSQVVRTVADRTNLDKLRNRWETVYYGNPFLDGQILDVTNVLSRRHKFRIYQENSGGETSSIVSGDDPGLVDSWQCLYTNLSNPFTLPDYLNALPIVTDSNIISQQDDISEFPFTSVHQTKSVTKEDDTYSQSNVSGFGTLLPFHSTAFPAESTTEAQAGHNSTLYTTEMGFKENIGRRVLKSEYAVPCKDQSKGFSNPRPKNFISSDLTSVGSVTTFYSNKTYDVDRWVIKERNYPGDILFQDKKTVSTTVDLSQVEFEPVTPSTPRYAVKVPLSLVYQNGFDFENPTKRNFHTYPTADKEGQTRYSAVSYYFNNLDIPTIILPYTNNFTEVSGYTTPFSNNMQRIYPRSEHGGDAENFAQHMNQPELRPEIVVDNTGASNSVGIIRADLTFTQDSPDPAYFVDINESPNADSPITYQTTGGANVTRAQTNQFNITLNTTHLPMGSIVPFRMVGQKAQEGYSKIENIDFDFSPNQEFEVGTSTITLRGFGSNYASASSPAPILSANGKYRLIRNGGPKDRVFELIAPTPIFRYKEDTNQTTIILDRYRLLIEPSSTDGYKNTWKLKRLRHKAIKTNLRLRDDPKRRITDAKATLGEISLFTQSDNQLGVENKSSFEFQFGGDSTVDQTYNQLYPNYGTNHTLVNAFNKLRTTDQPLNFFVRKYKNSSGTFNSPTEASDYWLKDSSPNVSTADSFIDNKITIGDRLFDQTTISTTDFILVGGGFRGRLTNYVNGTSYSVDSNGNGVPNPSNMFSGTYKATSSLWQWFQSQGFTEETVKGQRLRMYIDSGTNPYTFGSFGTIDFMTWVITGVNTTTNTWSIRLTQGRTGTDGVSSIGDVPARENAESNSLIRRHRGLSEYAPFRDLSQDFSIGGNYSSGSFQLRDLYVFPQKMSVGDRRRFYEASKNNQQTITFTNETTQLSAFDNFPLFSTAIEENIEAVSTLEDVPNSVGTRFTFNDLIGEDARIFALGEDPNRFWPTGHSQLFNTKDFILETTPQETIMFIDSNYNSPKGNGIATTNSSPNNVYLSTFSFSDSPTDQNFSPKGAPTFVNVLNTAPGNDTPNHLPNTGSVQHDVLRVIDDGSVTGEYILGGDFIVNRDLSQGSTDENLRNNFGVDTLTFTLKNDQDFIEGDELVRIELENEPGVPPLLFEFKNNRVFGGPQYSPNFKPDSPVEPRPRPDSPDLPPPPPPPDEPDISDESPNGPNEPDSPAGKKSKKYKTTAFFNDKFNSQKQWVNDSKVNETVFFTSYKYSPYKIVSSASAEPTETITAFGLRSAKIVTQDSTLPLKRAKAIFDGSPPNTGTVTPYNLATQEVPRGMGETFTTTGFANYTTGNYSPTGTLQLANLVDTSSEFSAIYDAVDTLKFRYTISDRGGWWRSTSPYNGGYFYIAKPTDGSPNSGITWRDAGHSTIRLGKRIVNGPSYVNITNDNLVSEFYGKYIRRETSTSGRLTHDPNNDKWMREGLINVFFKYSSTENRWQWHWGDPSTQSSFPDFFETTGATKEEGFWKEGNQWTLCNDSNTTGTFDKRAYGYESKFESVLNSIYNKYQYFSQPDEIVYLTDKSQRRDTQFLHLMYAHPNYGMISLARSTKDSPQTHKFPHLIDWKLPLVNQSPGFSGSTNGVLQENNTWSIADYNGIQINYSPTKQFWQTTANTALVSFPITRASTKFVLPEGNPMVYNGTLLRPMLINNRDLDTGLINNFTFIPAKNMVSITSARSAFSKLNIDFSPISKVNRVQDIELISVFGNYLPYVVPKTFNEDDIKTDAELESEKLDSPAITRYWNYRAHTLGDAIDDDDNDDPEDNPNDPDNPGDDGPGDDGRNYSPHLDPFFGVDLDYLIHLPAVNTDETIDREILFTFDSPSAATPKLRTPDGVKIFRNDFDSTLEGVGGNYSSMKVRNLRKNFTNDPYISIKGKLPANLVPIARSVYRDKVDSSPSVKLQEFKDKKLYNIGDQAYINIPNKKNQLMAEVITRDTTNLQLSVSGGPIKQVNGLWEKYTTKNSKSAYRQITTGLYGDRYLDGTIEDRSSGSTNATVTRNAIKVEGFNVYVDGTYELHEVQGRGKIFYNFENSFAIVDASGDYENDVKPYVEPIQRRWQIGVITNTYSVDKFIDHIDNKTRADFADWDLKFKEAKQNPYNVYPFSRLNDDNIKYTGTFIGVANTILENEVLRFVPLYDSGTRLEEGYSITGNEVDLSKELVNTQNDTVVSYEILGRPYAVWPTDSGNYIPDEMIDAFRADYSSFYGNNLTDLPESTRAYIEDTLNTQITVKLDSFDYSNTKLDGGPWDVQNWTLHSYFYPPIETYYGPDAQKYYGGYSYFRETDTIPSYSLTDTNTVPNMEEVKIPAIKFPKNEVFVPRDFGTFREISWDGSKWIIKFTDLEEKIKGRNDQQDDTIVEYFSSENVSEPWNVSEWFVKWTDSDGTVELPYAGSLDLDNNWFAQTSVFELDEGRGNETQEQLKQKVKTFKRRDFKINVEETPATEDGRIGINALTGGGRYTYQAGSSFGLDILEQDHNLLNWPPNIAATRDDIVLHKYVGNEFSTRKYYFILVWQATETNPDGSNRQTRIITAGYVLPVQIVNDSNITASLASVVGVDVPPANYVAPSLEINGTYTNAVNNDVYVSQNGHFVIRKVDDVWRIQRASVVNENTDVYFSNKQLKENNWKTLINSSAFGVLKLYLSTIKNQSSIVLTDFVI